MAAVTTAVVALGYTYSDTLFGTNRWSQVSARYDDPADGYNYYFTSLVKRGEKEKLSRLPSDFLSLNRRVRGYACRLELKDPVASRNNGANTKSTYIEDNTCSLFRLENFEKNGSNTLNLPLKLDASMLVKDRYHLVGTKQQLLRLNKKFSQKIPKGASTISIVDKKTGRNIYMQLNLDFKFDVSTPSHTPSNLISGWLQEKVARNQELGLFFVDKTFYCQLGNQREKEPCKVYKFSTPPKTNNFTEEQLKSLAPIADFANDLKEEHYYVLDFLDSKKSLNDLENLEINIYERVPDTHKYHLVLNFNYDKHLFGKYGEQNDHILYYPTPKKRVYLAKRIEPTLDEKLQPSTFSGNGANQTYKCKFPGNERAKPSTVNNLDPTCKLFDIPGLNNKKQKSITLSPNSLKEHNTRTVKLSEQEYFKLEVNYSALFNLNEDIEAGNLQRIQVFPMDKQSAENHKKHYMELELVQEVTDNPSKFAGHVQYLLVQSRHDNTAFTADSQPIKCKFYEADTGFDCDLYKPNTQLTPQLQHYETEGLDTLDLSTSVKEKWDGSTKFTKLSHYIVDLRVPMPIGELSKNMSIFHIYQHPADKATLIPSLKNYLASSEAIGNKNKDSTTEPTITPTIHFNVVKYLDGEPSSNKPMIFLN